MKICLFVKKIKGRLRYLLKREKRLSNGNEHKDEIFYVIGVDYSTEGLLAIIKNVLVHLEYALEKGYIPIVDMKNFKSQFQIESISNIWEVFFIQPRGYGLNDIEHAKNIIQSRNIASWPNHSIYVTILDGRLKERHDKLSEIYKELIIPNGKLTEYMDKCYKDIIGDKKNVLGVLCRGTDYTQKKPRNHPIQPSFEQIKNKIDDYIKKYSIEYIYVATEDAEYLEKFKNYYGDIILTINQKRFGKLEKNYISELGLEYNQLIQLNMDYYVSLDILSRCDYFIAGRTAGTIGASMMSHGFKDCYFFDLGYYK